MAFIPLGTYVMGVGEEDVPYSKINSPKRVTVSSFYMDETEITNNEYRQFVYWVKDSMVRSLLGEINPEEYLIEENEETGELYDPPFLNWETDIDWQDEETVQATEELFLPENERYFRKKQIDTRKLRYRYFWIDLKSAAKKDYSQEADPTNASFANRPQGMDDRSVYVKEEVINVYPDSYRVENCNNMIDKLREKLEEKAYNAAILYYKMERYKSTILSFENVLKDFPNSKYKEDILYYIVKSYYEYAKNSVIEMQKERYSAAIESYENLRFSFPESNYLKQAEKIYNNSKEIIINL